MLRSEVKFFTDFMDNFCPRVSNRNKKERWRIIFGDLNALEFWTNFDDHWKETKLTLQFNLKLKSCVWDDGHVYSICNRHFSNISIYHWLGWKRDDFSSYISWRWRQDCKLHFGNRRYGWWSSNEFWKLTTQGDFCKAFVLLSEKKEVLKDNRKWRWEISMTSKKSQKIIWRAGIS